MNHDQHPFQVTRAKRFYLRRWYPRGAAASHAATVLSTRAVGGGMGSRGKPRQRYEDFPHKSWLCQCLQRIGITCKETKKEVYVYYVYNNNYYYNYNI